MAIYRVTIPVTMVVEIDESNQETARVPALNGDTSLIATRRAIWCLFQRDGHAQRKLLGVKRLIINGRWENFESVEMEDANSPFSQIES